MREKWVRQTALKLISLLHQCNVKRTKRQGTDWEKLFSEHTSDKDYVQNAQRTLQNSIIRKQTT